MLHVWMEYLPTFNDNVKPNAGKFILYMDPMSIGEINQLTTNDREF